MKDEEIERHTLLVKARANIAEVTLLGGEDRAPLRALREVDEALDSLLHLRAEAVRLANDGGLRVREEDEFARHHHRVANAVEALQVISQNAPPQDGQAAQGANAGRRAASILSEIRQTRQHAGLLDGLSSDMMGMAQYLALSLERAVLYLRQPMEKRGG